MPNNESIINIRQILFKNKTISIINSVPMLYHIEYMVITSNISVIKKKQNSAYFNINFNFFIVIPSLSNGSVSDRVKGIPHAPKLV